MSKNIIKSETKDTQQSAAKDQLVSLFIRKPYRSRYAPTV
jgi:hypothetical protein